MAVKVTKEKGLDEQVKALFKTRESNGIKGLILLDKCIEQTASADRNWNGLARFMILARNAGQGARVAAIIRAAFGDSLIIKANSKHDTGATVVMKWEGAFPLSGRNAYSAVKAAIAAGQAWDSKLLSIKLKEVAPVTKKARVVTNESKTKVVKHLAAYMAARVAEGFPAGELLDMLYKELKGGKVTKV